MLVTGAASGIGAACADEFRSEQWHVICWDAASGGEGGVVVDVTDDDAVGRAAAELPPLDAVVHCVGIGNRESAQSVELSEWVRVLDVNLVGAFIVARHTFTALAAQHGSFIGVASIAATRWFRNRSAYCASKAGLVALVGCLAIEWAEHGVRAFSVSPGFTDSPMAQAGIATGLTSMEDIVRHTPQRRLMDASEIAAAIRSLTGPEFRGLTGSDVLIDGGFASLSGF